MAKLKPEIITFKVDNSVKEAMRGISNRSDFIRAAVLAALEGICPVCSGSGRISPNQRRHWDAFVKDHSLVECVTCHEAHLVCRNSRGKEACLRGESL